MVDRFPACRCVMRLFSVQFRATKEGKATVDRRYEVNPVDGHSADVQFL